MLSKQAWFWMIAQISNYEQVAMEFMSEEPFPAESRSREDVLEEEGFEKRSEGCVKC